MRWWHEFVANVGDLVPGGVPVVGALLLLTTVLGATLWFFFPEWVPRRRARARRGRWWRRGIRRRRGPRSSVSWRWRWRGWRLWWRHRLRWRRRRAGTPSRPPEPLLPDELPQIPAAMLVVGADELAAQGRYAEAVRERLRSMVRELVEREVLAYRPGWTVTEFAAIAGGVVPEAAAPLAAASDVFSQIWYGRRPAGPADDDAMRGFATRVTAALTAPEVRV